MNRPMTSYPCLRSRYADTELSTPPLMARTTRAAILVSPLRGLRSQHTCTASGPQHTVYGEVGDEIGSTSLGSLVRGVEQGKHRFRIDVPIHFQKCSPCDRIEASRHTETVR